MTQDDDAEFARIRDLWEGNVAVLRRMPDGSVAGIVRFIFTYGICSHMSETETYRGRWCHEQPAEAALAFYVWNGLSDPPGPWLKYKGGDGPERHNPLIFEHIEGRRYKRKLPSEIDQAKLWPAGSAT